MYAQELASHYSDVRRRLRSAPSAVKTTTREVHLFRARPEPPRIERPAMPEPDRSQTGAAPEPEPVAPGITVTLPIPTYPTIRSIVAATAAHFGVPVIDLMSQRRHKSVVRPRQIAMYLARVITPRSLPDIGRNMGGRDHTTILHAFHKITGLIDAGDPIADDIAAIRAKLEVSE